MFIYPSIFAKEENGNLFVRFPDLEGCFTEGENMNEAVKMAEEALGGYLASLYERSIAIPKPCDISSLKTNENEVIVMIYSDIKKHFSKLKAVKKTLTIPSWLNDLADKENINFSAVLQEAIIKQLGI